MVGIKSIVYVGNHGFEIDGPRIHHFESLTPPDIKRYSRRSKTAWPKILPGSEGVVIEDKGLTLSVHLPPGPGGRRRMPSLKIFHKTCRPYHAAKRDPDQVREKGL